MRFVLQIEAQLIHSSQIYEEWQRECVYSHYRGIDPTPIFSNNLGHAEASFGSTVQTTESSFCLRLDTPTESVVAVFEVFAFCTPHPRSLASLQQILFLGRGVVRTEMTHQRSKLYKRFYEFFSADYFAKVLEQMFQN